LKSEPSVPVGRVPPVLEDILLSRESTEMHLKNQKLIIFPKLHGVKAFFLGDNASFANKTT
jgi:hypothetical protein